jgi:RNA polymerase subunit RPABC4/transcription elongation factor Spt4/TM2 domain-containing membrane protein YozV
MYCRACGHEIRETAEICPNCGTKAGSGSEFCPECGVQTKENQQVCLNCGTALLKEPMRTPSRQAGGSHYCRECGSEVKENAEICIKCGVYPLNGRNYCQECGAKTNERQEFCTKCGSRLVYRTRSNFLGGLSDKTKSPSTATIISCFLPGIGQVYLGQVKKGLAIFAGSVVLGLISGGTLSVVVWIAAMVDAYLIGKKLAQGQTVDTWEFF